jgi:hypothetical protein
MTDLEKIVDGLLIFCDGLEAQTVTLRRELKQLTTSKEPSELKATIPEDRFSRLSWRNETGKKIGEYEIALIQDNLEQDWRHAFNILQANNATISNRFHEENYVYSYWLYDKMDYKIFRQRLAEAQK